MAASRGKVRSEGSIEKVARDKWRLHLCAGYDPSSKRYRRKTRTVFGSKADAVRELERFRHDVNEGREDRYAETGCLLRDYLWSFYEERLGTGSSELTDKRERNLISKVDLYFGGYPIDEIRPIDIRQTYMRIRQDGLMSESGIYKMHAKAKQVMKQALLDEMVARNPFEAVKVSRPKAKERRSLSREEAARLYGILAGQEPTSCTMAVLIALETGMRRGEVLGLQWKHVRLDEGRLYVAQQYASDRKVRDPKSETSKRWVSLSGEAVDMLRLWKARQAELVDGFNDAGRNRLFDSGGTTEGFVPYEQTGETPVVSSGTFGFYEPNCFARWFRKFCVDNGFGEFGQVSVWVDKKGVKRYKRSGYAGLTFHELRHTQATLLIGSGADIKTVQNRLGHSTASLTMNIYAHAIRQNDEMAARVISGILAPGGQPAPGPDDLDAMEAMGGPVRDDGSYPARSELAGVPEAQRVRDFFARTRRQVTRREVADACEIESRKRMGAILARLMDEGVVVKTGSTKNARYQSAEARQAGEGAQGPGR